MFFAYMYNLIIFFRKKQHFFLSFIRNLIISIRNLIYFLIGNIRKYISRNIRKIRKVLIKIRKNLIF